MKSHALTLALALVVGLVSCLATPSPTLALEVEIRIDGGPIRVGSPVEIRVMADAATLENASVSIEGWPSSQLASEILRSPVTEPGTVVWTPESAGLARVRVYGGEGQDGAGREAASAEMARHDLAVGHGKPPISALLVLALAGALLFGGVWTGLARQVPKG